MGIVRAACAGFLLSGSLVLAAATESATLRVEVHDSSGAPLANVEVEVASASSRPVPPSRLTGPIGTVEFALQAGPGYTARVAGAGLVAQISEPFGLEAGTTKTVLFTMKPAVVEQVRVRAGIVQLDEGGEAKSIFPSDLAEDLPILGRSYQNLLVLAPGVNDANHDGNPNVHGARERDFKATVDGVSNVDPLTGTYLSEVNPDAIDELEVITTGAPAEFGGAVGGFGRVITKEGTNSFSGSAGVYIRSSVFDGSSVNSGTDSTEVRYHDVHPTINFTGPIVRDKLFFALFHEYIDQGKPINLIGGMGQVIVTTGSRNLDKLTWQVDPRNKLTFQTQVDPVRSGPLGIDALTDPQSGYDYTRGGPGFQVHWDLQHSSTLLVQTVLGLTHTGVSFVPQTTGVKNGCAIDQFAASTPGFRHDFYGGVNGPAMDEDYCFDEMHSLRRGSYYQNYSDDRIRYTFKTDASYYLQDFLGTSHTFKAGVIAERRKYEGEQSLRAVSDWHEDPPTLYNQGAHGFGTIHRTVYLPGYPNWETNTAEGSDYGIYLEDQFRPRPNLSVRAGIRIDQENLAADGYEPFDPAREDLQFFKAYHNCRRDNPGSSDRCARSSWKAFHNYETFPAFGASPIAAIIQDPVAGLQKRQPQRFRISNLNFSPRLSLSWDPGNDGKSKLFATAGRYYGEIFLAVPAYEQGPDGFVFTYPVEGETVNCHSHPSDPNALICDYQSLIGPDSSAQVAPASIRQVDRNLKTPYQNEYTAGVSWELFREASITVTGIRRSYRDQLQDVDINHFIVVPAVHGRRALEALHNPFFNQIQLVGNFNSSDYRALEIEFRRRLHDNWEMDASYVLSDATGNGEDYAQTLGNDPALVEDEFGYLDYDQRHVFKLNSRSLVPQWNLRFSSSLSWQSGRPYSTIEEGFVYDLPRPYGRTQIGFGQTRVTFPTGKRNDLRNDSYWNVDLGVRKDFSVGRTSLELSLDLFNALNDTALYIQGVRNGRYTGYRYTGRQVQIGTKIAF